MSVSSASFFRHMVSLHQHLSMGHHDSQTGIIKLPAELLDHIFDYLTDRCILNLGKTCCILNQYAIPAFLRRKDIRDAENLNATVQPYHNGSNDELTGLILHFGLTKIKQLTCKLDRRPDWEIIEDFSLESLSRSLMEGLARNLRRLLQLVMRLTRIESIHLYFYPMGATWALSADSLQEFIATLFRLVNAAVSKSCKEVLVSHPHPLTEARPPYKLQLINGGNMVLQDILRRSWSVVSMSMRHSHVENDAQFQGEGWRYRQLFKYRQSGIIMPALSNVTPQRSLTALDLTSDFLPLPPFSSWTFAILKYSPITHLSLSIPRIISFEELQHYVLPQIFVNVSQLEELRIGFHREEMYNLLLDFLPTLPQLRKLTIAMTAYGHLPAKPPSAAASMPQLTAFTGSPYQLAYMLGGAISYPSLQNINIIADCRRGRPKLIDLAKQLALINKGVYSIFPPPTISLCASFVFPRGNSGASLASLNVDQDCTRHFASIRRLTVQLPDNYDTQDSGSHVLDHILEWLEIFCGLTALTLITRSYLDRASAIGIIRAEYPDINPLNIVEYRQNQTSHCHWSNLEKEPRYLASLGSSGCVCTDF